MNISVDSMWKTGFSTPPKLPIRMLEVHFAQFQNRVPVSSEKLYSIL